ncbi:MAG TPA: HTTM domain-containing protein [Bryobacteraceae bacterium]|nr:HTTM domain-containing protein [Bryobacteraceae bacterium]
MSIRTLARAWNDFFFKPQSPTPIALFRIFYGLLVLADLILLRPEWLTWFGPRGLVSMATAHQMEPGTRINLFSILPATAGAVDAFFWVFLLFTVLLIFGVWTRASALAVFLCVASIHERNLYIANSGDTLMRAMGFFLMFAPAGAAISVDRLLRIWRGREGLEIAPRAPWAQRMIQIEVALLYLVTCWSKSQGETWVNGTALYYVYHLTQFQRFPVPGFFQDPAIIALQTWFTLAVEFSLGALVWIREWRYYILAAGVVLHLSLEYVMNVPLFQWILLGAYITFVEPEDLARVGSRIRVRAAERITVVYDGASEASVRLARVLQAVDVLGRLELVSENQPRRARLSVRTASGTLDGFQAMRFLGRAVPVLWPLAIPSLLPLRRRALSAAPGAD